jgi:hypothetical protein
MKFFKALLDTDSGTSMLRFMSLMCCITAIALAFIGMNKANPDYSGLSLLCGTFLTTAFGAKVAQKFVEKDK